MFTAKPTQAASHEGLIEVYQLPLPRILECRIVVIAFPIVVCIYCYFGTNCILRWRCYELELKKQWDNLDRVSSKWAVEQPDCVDSWWYRAQAAIGEKQWAEAAEFLSHVGTNDSSSVRAKRQLAELWFEQLNQPLKAVQADLQIVGRDPSTADSQERLVRFYAVTLQRSELIRQAHEAIRSGGDVPMTYYYLVGASFLRDSDQYKLTTKWLASDPDIELFQVAQTLWVTDWKMMSYPKIAFKYSNVPNASELRVRYPHNAELLRYFCEESLLNGDVQAVRNGLSQMSEKAAENAYFWRLRSWLNFATGNLEAADTDARQAVKIDPFYWRGYHQLAEINRQRLATETIQRWAEVARSGQNLEDQMNRMESDQEYRQSLFRKILAYIELCDEKKVAGKMRQRLEESR